MQNLSQNEFNQIAEIRSQSRDELERITKIRRIKNYEKMTNEELIISILKSKQRVAKFFNNNNNNNDLYYNKISDIKRILNGLRDILPKKDGEEIDKLYKIEDRRHLSEEEKEENDEYLRKLLRILNNKEEHGPNDHDDFDYFGIKDIENLFDKVNEEGYYKPILVKSSFNGNYKYNESREDKERELSVNQYFNTVMPYSYDLINDHRIARRVCRIQINMHVNFISSKDTGETRTIYKWGNNYVVVSIIWHRDTNDIIKELFESFLHDYQKNLKTIKGSDFVFESVYLMDYKLYRVRLKRGRSYIKSLEWLENKKNKQ